MSKTTHLPAPRFAKAKQRREWPEDDPNKLARNFSEISPGIHRFFLAKIAMKIGFVAPLKQSHKNVCKKTWRNMGCEKKKNTLMRFVTNDFSLEQIAVAKMPNPKMTL